jgi:hypothetical protein
VVEAQTLEAFLARTLPEKEPLAEGLLHKRDLVAFAARRRHGKTTLLANLAVAIAAPTAEFLGYRIPEARRSLLCLLEDDQGDLQNMVRTLVGGRNLQGRIQILTRDDFREQRVPVEVRNPEFRGAIARAATAHRPDVIVLDNLAQVINAEYNDASRVNELMQFCYELARTHNAAVILAAHPRKEGEQPVSLLDDPEHFFESIMGSSHFVNSTGSLWGLERKEDAPSLFLGGRQRSEGNQGLTAISRDEHGWFEVVNEALVHLPNVLNTEQRVRAWSLLPTRPATFSYVEGQSAVRAALSSGSSWQAWWKECRRLRVIVDGGEAGKYTKAI